jgi:hypothetical protein
LAYLFVLSLIFFLKKQIANIEEFTKGKAVDTTNMIEFENALAIDI